jgi:putative transcriptional regulator
MQDSNVSKPADSMIGKLLVASTTLQDPILGRSVCLVVHQDTENVFAVLLNRPMTPPPGLAKMFHAGEPDKIAGPAGGNRFRKAVFDHPNPFPPNLSGADSNAATPPDDADLAAENPTDWATEAKGSDELLAAQTAAEASQSLGVIHFGGPLSGPVVAVHNSSEHAEAQAGRGVYVAAQRDLLENLVKRKPGSFRLIVGHLGWTREQLRAEREAGYWHMIDATDEDVFIGDQDLWPSVIRRATTASVSTWLGLGDEPNSPQWN